MIKNIFAFFLFFLLVSPSYAQTNSPAPTSSIPSETVTDRVNELKERIASKVAELNLVEKRGILGTVTKTSDTELTLEDIKGETRFVDVDEITKFSSPEQENFGISDIEEGDKIAVIGLYNKQSRRILARFVDVVTVPQVVRGVVSDTNEDEFTVTVLSEEGKETIVDVETSTRTSEHSEETGLERSGFSEIEIAQRVIVFGFADLEEGNRMSASRILVLPEIPVSPVLSETIEELDSEEATPSTGSGVKLTPITR